MKKMMQIGLLLSLGLCTAPLYAAPNVSAQKAIQNFNESCVRDLPQAILNTKTVQQYHFKYEIVPETLNSLPMPQAVETAHTDQKTAVKLIQSGCEFINVELIIDLPRTLAERNAKFCNSCAIQTIRKHKSYFKTDQSNFLMSGIDILEPHIKNTAIRLNHEYSDGSGEELSQTTTIKSLKKLPNQQGWQLHLITSVGPL